MNPVLWTICCVYTKTAITLSRVRVSTRSPNSRPVSCADPDPLSSSSFSCLQINLSQQTEDGGSGCSRGRNGREEDMSTNYLPAVIGENGVQSSRREAGGREMRWDSRPTPCSGRCSEQRPHPHALLRLGLDPAAKAKSNTPSAACLAAARTSIHNSYEPREGSGLLALCLCACVFLVPSFRSVFFVVVVVLIFFRTRTCACVSIALYASRPTICWAVHAAETWSVGPEEG